MLIDESTLNPNLTYVGIEVGTSIIAKIIQNLSHKIYKNIPSNKIASHTFALRYKQNQWFLWEAHAKWKGIREYPLKEYLQQNSETKQIFLYPYNLNHNAMDYWKKFNPGYSLLNLCEIAEQRLIGLKIKDTQGFICSEAIANCSTTYDICFAIQKPLEEICPADWQYFFLNNFYKT